MMGTVQMNQKNASAMCHLYKENHTSIKHPVISLQRQTKQILLLFNIQ